MNGTIRIRVRYPARPDDRLTLRTSLDWEEELAPIGVDDGRSTWVFEVRALPERPRVYYKACRHRDERMAWSVGSNAVAFPGEHEIYPHFDDGQAGAISERFSVGERTLRVYTPPGYAENVLKRYPVLYAHDGANLFFPDEAFTGVDWGVDETLDTLNAMNLADKVIVVALYATAEHREREYCPPGWEPYARELISSIKPAIDARYRTLDGPSHTAVMGSSLGGVVSLYLAWQHADVFGMAACLSSSFGLRDDLLSRIWEAPTRPSIRVYLDSGWPGDNFESTREVRDALLAKGYAPGSDVLHLAFPGAAHHETSWSDRLHLPFQFLFGEQFHRR